MVPDNVPGVDAILLTFQGMMGSLNWRGEEWKANMADVDSMMFSMDEELKNKYTSIKGRSVSKMITSGRCWSILPTFDGRKILQQGTHTFIYTCDHSY